MGNQQSLKTPSPDDFDDTAIEARLEAFNRKLENRRRSEAVLQGAPVPERSERRVSIAARNRQNNAAGSSILGGKKNNFNSTTNSSAVSEEGRKAFESRHNHLVGVPGQIESNAGDTVTNIKKSSPTSNTTTSVLLVPSPGSPDSTADERPAKMRSRSHEPARRTSSGGLSHSSQEEEENKMGLTVNQVAIIRNAWSYARRAGTHEPGYSIISQVIATAPPELSAPFKSVGEEKLIKHARAFTDFLNLIIGQLDSDVVVTKKLRDLGRQHVGILTAGSQNNNSNSGNPTNNAQHQATQGGQHLSSADWELFRTAMIDCTRKWGPRSLVCQELITAWTQLVTHLIGKMKEGYYSEIKRKRTRNWTSMLHDEQRNRRRSLRRESIHATPLASRRKTSFNNTTYSTTTPDIMEQKDDGARSLFLGGTTGSTRGGVGLGDKIQKTSNYNELRSFNNLTGKSVS